MLRSHLWQGVATTRAISIRGNLGQHISTASRYFSRATSTNSTASSCCDQSEEQLDKLKDDLKSDAYIRMLATPLRRCTVTQLPLPRAMMFKMVSQRSQPTEESEVDLSIPIEEPDVVKPGVKQRSRRYILKEARKSEVKALLRAQRLLLHKMVTSITSKSRDHFTQKLAFVNKQLEALRKVHRGVLMPVGLTRDSLRQSRGLAQGKGVWVTLTKTIAAQALDRKANTNLHSTSSPPSTLLDLVQEGLEQRVVEEARLLLQRVISTPSSPGNRSGWLVRRLIGREMRGIMQDGRVELRDVKQARLACLVIKEGQMPTLQQQEADVYDLQLLIGNEERCNDIKRSFQSIAVFINRQQMKDRRQQIGRKQSESEAADDKSSEERKQINGSIRGQGIKWPRVLVVRRDERTVDLCIALWRLNAWCQSG